MDEMVDKLRIASKIRRALVASPIIAFAGLISNSVGHAKTSTSDEVQHSLKEYATVTDLLNSLESSRGPGSTWKASRHTYIESDRIGDIQTAANVNLVVQPTNMGFDVQAFGAKGDSDANSENDVLKPNDTDAFLAAINAAMAHGRGDIYIPPSSGHYKITQNLHSPESVNWIFGGGIVDCTHEDCAVLINGGINPGVFHSQCFSVHPSGSNKSSLKIRSAFKQGSHPENMSVSTKVTRMSPQWFDGTMSEKIQKVYQTGSSRTICTVPSGQFPVNSTLDLSPEKYGSHLVLEGSSFLATTLEMPAGSTFTGIDASLSDECEIKNIRVIEAVGKRTGICFALGGTSLKVHNCWAGNAKYGFFQNKGAGTRCFNNYVEACNYGFLISGDADESNLIAGAPVVSRGVRDLVVDGGMTYNCGFGIVIETNGRNNIRGVTISNMACKNHRHYALGIVDERMGGDIKGVSVNGCQFLNTSSKKRKSDYHYGVYVKSSNVSFTGSVFADNRDTGIMVDGGAHVILSACHFGNYRGGKQQSVSIGNPLDDSKVELFGILEI